MGGFAWVTLATNDSYSLGALVLAHSLKQAGTKQQLAVLITPGVTPPMREKLSTVFNVVQEVNILDSRDETNLRLLKRPELGITFTKLHCWRLTQFDKCVFLDADTLVLQNCDELFERDELSAAPDVGWPDCFNSGVFVYSPANETYEKLITFALEKGSFDGGDQGLLNLYFSDWAHKDIGKHLPFIYNMCSTACYSYLPAFKQFGRNAKIIHFIGATKPWLQYFNTETKKVQPSGDSSHLTEVLQRWWDIFCSLIHPQLSPDMTRSGSDSVHLHGSPSILPENYPQYPSHHHEPHPASYYHPTPAGDYQNVWDPWDEYYIRQSQLQNVSHSNENQPFESLNTNAYSDARHLEDSHHYESEENVQPTPYIHNSQPQFDYIQTNSFHETKTIHSEPVVPYIHSPQHFEKHSEPEVPQHFQIHSKPEVSHLHSPRHSQGEIHVPFPTPFQPDSQHAPNNLYPDIVHAEWNKPSLPQPTPHQHSQQDSTDHHYSDIPQHFHDVVIENISQHFHEQSFHRPTLDITPHTGPPGSPDETIQHATTPKNIPNSSQPVLPIESEATSTISNAISLHNSTYEDSSKNVEDAGLAGAFAQLTLGVPRTAEQVALDDLLRRQAWEQGNIDYLGKDSFQNIWSKIEETLSLGTEPVSEAGAESVPELPKEPTSSPTASAVTTPQSQAEATSEVIQETVATQEEPKKESEPQSISTVAIPTTPFIESLTKPTLSPVEPPSTESLPPIPLPPPTESPKTITQDPVSVPDTAIAQKQAEGTPVVTPEEAPKEVLPTPVPQEVTPVPQEATAIPQEATPVPQEATPVPQEATAVPQEAAPVPQEATQVPQEQLLPETGAASQAQPKESTPTTPPDAPSVVPVTVPSETAKVLEKPVAPEQAEVKVAEVLTPQDAPGVPKLDSGVAPQESTIQSPVLTPQDAPKEVPAAITQGQQKETPLAAPQEVPKPSQESEIAPKADSTASKPNSSQEQTVLSAPVSPVADVQKLVEKVATEPTIEPIAAKSPKAVVPENKESPKETTTPPAESCPKPVKSPKEGGKVKKTEKESVPVAAKVQTTPPAAQVTEATPPTSPPIAPQVKQTKEALAVDTNVPDTPPPASSEGASATPVPPPRKGSGGPKKPSAKSKK